LDALRPRASNPWSRRLTFFRKSEKRVPPTGAPYVMLPPHMDTPSTPTLCFLLWLTVFVVHAACPVTTSFDSRWSVHTAVSLVREGNADLDEYRSVLSQHQYYGVEKVGEHYYSMFPIGVPLLALPFVNLLDNIFGAMSMPAATEVFGAVERVVASFFVGLAAVIVYLTGRQRLDRNRALALVFVFAFCTSAWSTASRALWQHGPSILLLSLGLYLLLLGRQRSWPVWLAGVPLALACFIRPTNVLPLGVLTVYVLRRHRRQSAGYLLGCGAVTAAFLFLHVKLYAHLLPAYYAPGRLELHAHFAEALLGNLVSPGRGLFVYSPVFLLSGAGAWMVYRSGGFGPLERALAVIVIGHWLIVSAFPHWWAGHSYGPRFFADMIPFFVYFLIPVAAHWSWPASTRQRWATFVIVLATSVSFVVHFRGAVHPAVHEWNRLPVDVDARPSRVWDWSDPPFLRGLS